MDRWSEQLEKDLQWREEELVLLRLQVAREEKDSPKYKTLLRAMCAMLYAHYEGFCKFAWDLYLDELTRTGIKRKECKEKIAQLSLLKKFKTMKGDLSPEAIWQFGISGFNELLEEQLDFQIKLETESNLWPNIFEENVLKAGLECNIIDEYRTEIRALVDKRNQIAHGKTLIIKDLDEYKKYENAAHLVMHDLAVAIVECLDKRQYLCAP